MRIARLLPAVAAVLLTVTASAQQAPPPDVTRSAATLFYPVTLARAEERGFDGTAAWRMIDLGPVRALEAVLSFPGEAADMIVLIEENPYRDLPDDMLVHAWPEWPATAEGPAVAWAYLVGVEMAGERQIGLIGTARGDWTTGMMEGGAARNHERLTAATVLIVELGLPDGKAFVGIGLEVEQQALLAGIIPAGALAFPLAGPAEPRILAVDTPAGTGGVLWDTPHDDRGGVAVRGRFYLYDEGVGFTVTFASSGDDLVATVQGDAAALGTLASLSIRTEDGEIALPAGEPVVAAGGAAALFFGGEAAAAALEILRGPGAALMLHFADAAGTVTPVVATLPQTWSPFAFLAAPP